ncbi:methyltransferase domain-containing protein [Aestuariibaculum sp. YM273]|uniref:class I SAM-dependent methyltransferase n=1 Tax=Aestuariibaculum sp. YM273 TaxID=3070659 RepID=UPI0027DAC9CD|nr:methyltransferase domain-containing protein [Aestuariibaculum sp. YM273]WMI65833.1 methyltransferase domain-containing protein [Aestuariibaculum sp. YM273]
MHIYSLIYKNTICSKVEDVSIKDLKHLYKNGYGLGEDLVEHLSKVRISLYKCPKSNFFFYIPSNLEGDATYYKQLELRNKNYYNTDSWEFFKAKKLIHRNEKVLEIGSGNLSFLRMLKDKTSNLVGIELNDTSVYAGVSEGFNMYNIPVEEFSKTHNEEFDVLCSFQVLEHISYNNLDSFIKHSLKCLKNGGRFIVAVPNSSSIFFKEKQLLKYYTNDSSFKLHCTTLALNMPPHHMGLWNENSLKSLVKKYPIKVKSIHKEKLAHFRVNLVRDILISKASKFLGLKLSKFLCNKLFSNEFIKKYFKGDSILIEFVKR